MTATATVLPTGFATEVDGAAALVVGYVHAFPHHPASGSWVRPFAQGDSVAAATGVIGAPLYALVRVDWATEVITVDPISRSTRSNFVAGVLGMPRGTTWYLHPAVYDAENGAYALDSHGYGASAANALVPGQARAEVQSWGHDGGGVPAEVRVHNFPR
ncbi:hypothetical protein ABIC28_005101 [Rhodococcus sp. PvR044]|uniref:hypothetical protein n=1 Tax=Rhodococcus sp. PvR044 TaxID=3156402 RepID=UPI003399E29A